MAQWTCHLLDYGRELMQGVSRLAFPPRCVFCDRDLPENRAEADFCGPCLQRLAPAQWNACPRCGAEFSAGGYTPGRCPACRNDTFHFSTVVALGGYHARLRKVVLRMKRSGNEPLSLAIGRLLAQRRQEQLEALQAELILPVPMSWRRRLLRRVNNPDLLAECLAATLRIPVRYGVLVRQRNTLPQTNLSPTSRRHNMRRAFHVRQPQYIAGARILLVDDVLTTGTTCDEAARTLLRAGAKWVAVAVVARGTGREPRATAESYLSGAAKKRTI